jgi:uncharacterized radical SAM superfamily Fe-S cluster-containing enzyme
LAGRTESLCPICLKVLPATLEIAGDVTLLRRVCPEHGPFDEAVWRGLPSFESWKRPKKPAAGVAVHRPAERGCPHDCGLCPEHAQRPCTILLELTQACNLGCPVCYAASPKATSAGLHVPLDDLLAQLPYIKRQAGRVVLQLSGGEPTLHPDLPAVAAAAARLFPAVQLNTNGLELAARPSLARELAAVGLTWVFLQFDSLRDEVYQAIRGRPLTSQKLAAVEACRAAGLPTILTPTVVKGLNDDELGDLVRYATAQPLVRGLHFQPMTASGRTPFAGSAGRLTLPELLQALARQTDGQVDPAEAFPPGCEHERCSFHLRYRRLADGRLVPRPGAAPGCCSPDKFGPTASEAQDGDAGLERAVDIILRSWGPLGASPRSGTAASGGHEGPQASAGPSGQSGLLLPMAPPRPLDAFDEFLAQAARETFSLTAMAFQDAWTADLARFRGCCVHVFDPPDRFVPFCAMNLTSADGQPLHRRPPRLADAQAAPTAGGAVRR